MLSSLLLAAAGIAVAAPITQDTWLEFDDYPNDAIRSGYEGTSEFEVVVAPTGDPVACSITRSSGANVLDRQTCTIVMKRGKFSPARNAQSKPAYGTYRSQVDWKIDLQKWRQTGPAPMRQIILSRLPAGMQSPFYLQYAVMVDEAGRATDCAPAIADYPDLAKASCAVLMTDMPPMPVALVGGATTPAVRSVWVAYSL